MTAKRRRLLQTALAERDERAERVVKREHREYADRRKSPGRNRLRASTAEGRGPTVP